ncbi:MAG: phosphohydrolase (MutT/NUDIX family protein) [uncultured bacterium]|nr:MAG: phosphohydrolase (MutT/NUDIX family protein) [uncultured bacterium]
MDYLKQIKANLPKHPGILGRDKYHNSGVIIPIVKIDSDYNFLFQVRSEHVRQAGEICFPGGMHDYIHDKNFLDTAIRETVEEIGIKRCKISILGQMDTLFAPMGISIDSFIAYLKIKDLNELKINKKEVEKIFILPVSFFINNPPKEYKIKLEVHPHYINEKGEHETLLPVKDLGLPEKYSKPWTSKFYKIYVYQTPQGVIWGITAELVKETIKLFH